VEYEVIKRSPQGVASVAHTPLSTFLTERYCLYKQLPGRSKGGIFCGTISHSPWQLTPVRLVSLKQNSVFIASGGVLPHDMPTGAGEYEVHFGSVASGVDFRMFQAAS
jgi:uncharacterized protein YqjF (DUF2071 family)